MQSTMMDNFQMGRVISRTFSAFMANAVTFLLLAGVLTAPVLAATYYLTRSAVALTAISTPGTPTNPAVAMAALSQTMSTSAISYLVVIVFTYILQAALVQGTVTWLNGEKPSLGGCLSAGFKSFMPLIALAILSFIGMAVGFVLLVVPGFMLAMMWSVVVPVFVVEHPGVFASFGRSSALTKGHRWAIFGLVLLYVVLSWIVSIALTLVMGVSLLRAGPANLAPAFLIASWVVRVPLSALAAVGIAAIYYELRLVKEGVGPQQLAAAFD